MGRLSPWLSALLLLAGTVPPARACINDREVVRAEREFRSQYLPAQPTTRPAPSPADSGSSPLSVALVAAGAALLLGAAAGVLLPGRHGGG